MDTGYPIKDGKTVHIDAFEIVISGSDQYDRYSIPLEDVHPDPVWNGETVLITRIIRPYGSQRQDQNIPLEFTNQNDSARFIGALREQKDDRWASIPYDSHLHRERVISGLTGSEALFAVFDLGDSGDGFVGITSKRVIVAQPGDEHVFSVPYHSLSAMVIPNHSGRLGDCDRIRVETNHGLGFDLDFTEPTRGPEAYLVIARGMQNPR